MSLLTDPHYIRKWQPPNSAQQLADLLFIPLLPLPSSLRVEHSGQFVLELPELREVVSELSVDGLQDLPLLVLRVQRRVQLGLQLRLRLAESVVLPLESHYVSQWGKSFNGMENVVIWQ